MNLNNKLIAQYDKLKNYLKTDILSVFTETNPLLYRPIEYRGFVLFASLELENRSLNILIDCELYGFIEYLSYQRNVRDTFYLSEHLTKRLSQTKLLFLKKIVNIIITDVIDININYDVILVSELYKIKYYLSYGENIKSSLILCLQSLSIINSEFIETINQYITYVKNIDFIIPELYSNIGEFIIVISNSKKVLNSNFFNYYLRKFIYENTYKNINNTEDINAINIKNSIIFFAIKYNLPLKPDYTEYYNYKLIRNINGSYTILNPIKYQLLLFDKTNIDDDIPNLSIDSIIVQLNKIKSAIDTLKLKKWMQTTFSIDNYKKLGDMIANKYEVLINKNVKVSNAFLKMYEILMSFSFFNKQTSIKTFHFCESPGMFIVALNHYLQTKTQIKDWDWYGNSITEEGNKNAVIDRFNFIKNNEKKWLIGPKNGDITKIETINYFKEKLNEVDFITSDCGISIENESPTRYEELIAFIDFCQLLNAINLLKRNGSCILKLFIPLEKMSNKCLLYTTTKMFESTYLFKPITSRAHNSEIYIVGLNLIYRDEALINHMLNIVNNNSFNVDSNWLLTQEIPRSFINQVNNYIIDIIRQQIEFLLRIFYYYYHSKEIDKLHNIFMPLYENWCKIYSFESNKGLKIL